MKRSIFILVLLISVFFSIKVNAKEKYFYNDNSVVLSEKEYKFISEVFYEGYQNLMTIEDYESIFSEDVLNSDVKTNQIINNDYMLLGTTHSTASKSLKISSVCLTTCLIVVTAEWIKSPVVRSYDVIGARLVNTSLLDTPKTTVSNSSGSSSSDEIVKSSNGFGVSIKLLSSGSDMLISQYFHVSESGTVYASYQHAADSITLADSKKYTISSAGYGEVFLFNNTSIKNHYDGMDGVSISL